jgi:inosine/xanthosine triphosphatase
MSDASSTWTLTVAVGTTNPSKLRAVESSLRKVFYLEYDISRKISLHGYNVPSGVANQPFGDLETRLGAQNRAQEAFASHVREHNGVEPHLSIGLEGGLDMDHWKSSFSTSSIIPEEMERNVSESTSLICMAWMAVYGRRHSIMSRWALGPALNLDNADNSNDINDSSNSYLWGWAKTSTFLIPPAMSNLILREGMELGDADDQIFGRTNSKSGSGTVGMLSRGLIDRSNYYEQALILALVPWIRPDVYPITNES